MDEGSPVKHTLKSVLKPVKDVLWNLLLISIGSVLCAVAVNGILVPLQFLSAGFTGVALIIHYLMPVLTLGMLYFLLNVPIFLVGWKFVGLRFFLYSIAGMAASVELSLKKGCRSILRDRPTCWEGRTLSIGVNNYPHMEIDLS